MLKNNVKIAARNILKNKKSNIINIIGLTVGFTFSFFILLWVQDEMSYDKFHEKAQRISRVTQNYLLFNSHFARCSPAFAPLLEENFPGIECVRLNQCRSILRIDNIKYYNEKFFFADKSVFDVFDIKLKKGNIQTALQNPHSIIISEKAARKYFGNTDPMGKILPIINTKINNDEEQDYKITGIMEEIPGNSHFHMDIIASFTSQSTDFSRKWHMMGNFYTYVLLPTRYPVSLVEDRLPEFLDKHVGKNTSKYISLHLQPLTKIHLHSNLDREIEVNGNIKIVRIFTLAAFLILIIACINYMNFATAKSGQRCKEVGVRKLFGADRKEIIKQFFGESVILFVFTFILSVILMIILLPIFNNLSGKQLVFFSSQTMLLLALFFALVIILGFFSGGYPALFYSSYQPIKLLKGVFIPGTKGAIFRKILITIQFSISLILIIFTLTIHSQVNYMRNKELGFNNENIIAMRDVPLSFLPKYLTFKNELLPFPGIKDVTAAIGEPSLRVLEGGFIDIEGKTTSLENRLTLNILSVDANFIDFMEMQLAAGINFSKDLVTDSPGEYIINETAVKTIGWKSPKEALNKLIRVNNLKQGPIIGVVKDFHYSSLHQKVDPLVLFVKKNWFFCILIKVHPHNISTAISLIEKKWFQLSPRYPFDYFFTQDLFAQLYRKDEKQFQILGIFSILAIFVSCLGIFGLISFTAAQRTKEIGIRKTLGASILQMNFLLTREIMLLVFISFMIAALPAYIIVNQWLQKFAYRIEINGWIFVLSGLGVLLIALLTVSVQVIRASTRNPLEALRYE